jgi:glucuronate isomerase
MGSAWWFCDHIDGMTEQMRVLGNLGLLSRFVGMLTDSRSFLSYPRHEYFRRILCNMLGTWIENGEVPADFDLVGGMVQDISFNNAKKYFEGK